MTHATPDGTARYQARIGAQAGATHFADFGGLRVSSIGLGTYLGEPDTATSDGYRAAAVRAFALGCNVFDTAINYRFQLSERALGAALAELPRDEVFLATKGGYVPYDGGYPADPAAYIRETFIRPGIAAADDFAAAGQHCMAPAYLAHQLSRSRANLRLDSIDLYYVHNPESQLADVPRAEFNRRLRAAFAYLEQAAADGLIGGYGIATWSGLRTLPSARDYLVLEDVVALAREAGGDGHHFRAVQLPLNLAMTEALDHRNQPAGDKWQTVLASAHDMGLAVFASATLHEGRLTRNLPGGIRRTFGANLSDAQRALQFARSVPGVSVALAGMSRVAHVEENMRLAAQPRLSPDEFRGALR